MAVAITESPRTSPHSPRPLLDVRMTLPRSYRMGMRANRCRGRQTVIGLDEPNSSMMGTFGVMCTLIRESLNESSTREGKCST
jgi:hypothetical protein